MLSTSLTDKIANYCDAELQGAEPAWSLGKEAMIEDLMSQVQKNAMQIAGGSGGPVDMRMAVGLDRVLALEKNQDTKIQILLEAAADQKEVS